MPVGRLDKDTTGLLLLPTDGELNHRLLSPGRHVDKRYRALVEGVLTEKDVETFAAGMDLGDFTAQPARLHRCAFGPLNLDPALQEGQWRELTAEELQALHQAAGMAE